MSAIFHVISLFPQIFDSIFSESIIGKAKKNNIWHLHTYQMRDFAEAPHYKVDDTPYGGGNGMVIKPPILEKAINNIANSYDIDKIIYFTPRGRKLEQAIFEEYKSLILQNNMKATNIILICGRYEALDERIMLEYDILEYSLGDFILSGGELCAASFMDGVLRLLPNILGSAGTLETESFCNEYEHLLEYPHYTKPRIWKGHKVPEILLSGNHAKINAWRKEIAINDTKKRRPDLYKKYLTKISTNK